MANDVMIDMETLSTNPDCVILLTGDAEVIYKRKEEL